MPWYAFWYNSKGTEYAVGPYHSPGKAQGKLDDSGEDGEVEHYMVGTLAEAKRLHKAGKDKLEAATRNIRNG